MEGARVGRARQEGLAPEDQREHLQRVSAFRLVEGEQAVVVAGKIEDGREIDFEELLGDRPRALVVEPPPRAIGEDAPAEVAGGHIVDPPQVAQHLGRWRRLLAVPPGAAVERALPALGLHHRKAELVAPPFLGRSRWPDPSLPHPQTANRPARPPGRMRSGFAVAGSPSTQAERGRARSDRPRSGFRWALRRPGSGCRSRAARPRCLQATRRPVPASRAIGCWRGRVPGSGVADGLWPRSPARSV